MKHTVFALVVLGATLIAAVSQAATIDTNPTWDGNVNDSWFGSGQSLSVGAVDTRLDDISFYFDPASVGKVFNFTLSDALVGGTIFFSQAVTIAAGINTLLPNTNLAPNSTFFALFDYNGFNGRTAHFSYFNGYAGGQSYFFDGGSWEENFTGLDHRFIANFSDPVPIPLPATLPLLFGALALGGIVAARRKTRQAA